MTVALYAICLSMFDCKGGLGADWRKHAFLGWLGCA